MSLAIALAATSVFASAAPTIKLPLDEAAPMDPRATVSRTLSVRPIDKAKGAYVAVGPWGRILVTRDSGKTWMQSAVPVSSDLTAVHFPTPQKGWAVGHDGVVLHSADGGKTWVRQLDGRQYGDIMVQYYEKLTGAKEARPEGLAAKALSAEEMEKLAHARAQYSLDEFTQPAKGSDQVANPLDSARRLKDEGADKPFLDVWFENEQSGWIVGAFNLILKTNDGGKTWEPWIDRIENGNYTLFAMDKVGDEVFIVGELGLALRLDRAQNRFVKLATPRGGAYWKSAAVEEVPSDGGSYFGLTGNPGVVIFYGLGGRVVRSRDAGKTWETLNSGIGRAITGGAFLGDGRLVLVSGDGQVLVSRDDGDSFSRARLDRPMPLNSITPIDGDKVIVGGERGVAVETIR